MGDIVNSNENIGRIEGQLEGMLKQQEEIRQLLLGDGRAGALERVTCIEENLKVSTEIIRSVGNKLDKVSSTLEQVSDLVSNHVKDENLHSSKILLNRKTLGLFVLGFVILHEVVDKVPSILGWLSGWIR